MPTYEFRCPDGTIIERVFKMSEAPQAVPAPDGSGMAVRIISGGASLIFKGSGFYITDYGKDGKKHLREGANRPDAKPTTKPVAGADVRSDSATPTAASAPAASKGTGKSGPASPSSGAAA